MSPFSALWLEGTRSFSPGSALDVLKSMLGVRALYRETQANQNRSPRAHGIT